MSVLDETANNHDGTYNGALYQQPGKINYSLGFDGASIVTVPDSSDFDFGSGDWTIAYWVNAVNVLAVERILSKQGGTPTVYQIFSRPDGEIYVEYSITTIAFTALSGDNVPPNNTWYHLCYSKNGTTAYRYLNGILIDSKPVAGVHSTNTVSLIMGGYNTTTQTFNGYIDELMIWKGIALTDDEILNYNNWNWVY